MLQEQSWPLSCLSALRDGLIEDMGSAAQRGEPSTGTCGRCEGGILPRGSSSGGGMPTWLSHLEWDRAQLGEQKDEERKGKR